jgi:hypothetical protein
VCVCVCMYSVCVCVYSVCVQRFPRVPFYTAELDVQKRGGESERAMERETLYYALSESTKILFIPFMFPVINVHWLM